MPGFQFFDSKECEWADMTIMFAGAPLTKIRGVKYKAAQDKDALYAQGNEPISIQHGKKSYEGEIKVLKGALDDMNTAAIAAGGENILDVLFDIAITYQPKATRPLQTDVLKNVEIKQFEKGWDQGAKNMDITLPIVFLGLDTD